MKILVLDCIFIILILYGGLTGYRRGLIKTAGSVASFVLGVAAAVLGWEPVTNYLQSNYALITVIAAFLGQRLPVPVFDDVGAVASSLFYSSLYAYQGVIYHISRLLVSGLVFVLILVLTTKLLGILWQLLSMMFDGGLLGLGNRVGGLAFESLKVILILSIVCGLAMPVIRSLSQTGVALELNSYLDRSFLVPHLEALFQIMGTITGIRAG